MAFSDFKTISEVLETFNSHLAVRVSSSGEFLDRSTKAFIQ